MAASSLPIIDLSGAAAAAAAGEEGERRQQQVRDARVLVDAAAEHGFVYVRNGGGEISAGQIERAFDVARRLFEAPLEEKQRCKMDARNRGWAGMHAENLDPTTQRVGDPKEAFNFSPEPAFEHVQPLPSSISSAGDVAETRAFRASCHALCLRLLDLFGLGLGAEPASFFTDAHAPVPAPADAASTTTTHSTLRMLYYPPPPAAMVGTDAVRAGAHSDYGSLTLLFRLPGQAGLEIQTRGGGWVPVPVRPAGTEHDAAPPVLVNIGDLLSYWTGGLLRSTVHRVTFAGGAVAVEGESNREARYSIAFFCHPAPETGLTAVPSERVRSFRAGRAAGPDEGSKFLTANEHLQSRLRASFMGVSEQQQ